MPRLENIHLNLKMLWFLGEKIEIFSQGAISNQVKSFFQPSFFFSYVVNSLSQRGRK